MDINYFFKFTEQKYTIKWHLRRLTRSYLTLVHPMPFHTAKQCEEGSDSQVNKVYRTIYVEYTKISTKL